MLNGMRQAPDPGCDNGSVPPTPAQQARAAAIAAAITARLAGLPFALPGTLADRKTRCGYPGCRCHADPPRRHGPYHQWTRRKNGKTATRILTDDQLADRKTGRRYDIPVVAHRLDGELYALTDAAWRNNFRGGADVEVTLDGHVTRMRGQLLEDPQAVAPLYARAIDHFGAKRAQRMLGLKIHTPGTPAAEELAEAARRYHLTAIRLTVRT